MIISNLSWKRIVEQPLLRYLVPALLGFLGVVQTIYNATQWYLREDISCNERE